MMNDEVRFLIQCYFGFEEDPVLMAIDRAYRDMATHTLSGDAQTELYPKRKDVTEYLHKELLTLPDSNADYDKWHKKTAAKIAEIYPKLTIGQIQKWINMTIKYIYTLGKLGVDGISEYFTNEKNVKSFHAPLDSYVLKAIEEESPTWSNISDYDEYLRREAKIDFITEYNEWSQYAKDAMKTKDGKEKAAEQGSYKRYIQEHKYEF